MTQKVNDSKRPLCLLMCDIDHFKQVNDTYGHQAGDIVIKTIAIILKDTFRVTDLIARYGGEEFTILLNDVTVDEAMYIAERVRKKIESIDFKIKTETKPIKKTISIGLTNYKIGESISEFIERADKAMYQAKESGRNRIVKIL
jgi:two-component system cell cycle response regulator